MSSMSENALEISNISNLHGFRGFVTMVPVITISGSAGTGKSVNAESLAGKLGLRYISAGKIFRKLAEERNLTIEQFSKKAERDTKIDLELDQKMREEARRGDVVLEGRLVAWMTKDLDAYRIRLHCPLEIRIKRIAERESRSPSGVKNETIFREESERKRYRELYDIDIEDYEIYDLILNTSVYTADATTRILEFAVREYVSSPLRRGKEIGGSSS
ncbi:MAG: (d)CMP kinase [Promethearchaeota archaeon]